MTDKEITREKTFSEELPYFKERIEEVFDNYNNPNGNEDPLYINVIRDSKRIIRKAEAEITYQQAVIRMLQKKVNLVSIQFQDLQERTDKINVEAYKEFAEHLKEKWFNNHYDSPDVDFSDFVDNFLKEFLKFINRKPCKGSRKDSEQKQGLVYPFFNEKYIYEVPDSFDKFCVSCDYGTVNPTSMGLWGEHGESWYRIDEFYHDSRQKGFQMTDEEYYRSLVSLVGKRKLEFVVVDPSAASFIECIKRHGKFTVKKAENDVLAGIHKTSDALKTGKIRICKTCPDIIREFSLYRWDEGAKYDAPRKENDHAMDDMRYFVDAIERGYN